MSIAPDILVVDDEADIRELISDILRDEGFKARAAANSTDALKAISEKVPSAIILDIWLQGSDMDGLGILEVVKKRYPLMPVIIISGHGTIETAVNAIKMGAYDYLEKPFTQDKLMIMLRRACENAKLRRENYDLKTKVADKAEIIGESHIMQRLKSEIEKAAPTLGRVMISGPAGSGKGLIARILHKQSKNSSGPFITFSPSGLSDEVIRRELFGEFDKNDPRVKAKRLSLLESANNGTLYIDEITDLTLEAQAKLLRFLQEQILERSDSSNGKLNVRIITSTTHDVEEAVSSGKIRQDLFYRLNVVPIKMPSLADRKDDIPLLVNYFVSQLVKFSGLKTRTFSEEAIASLQAYSWPGNIRQLRNVVEWTLIMNPVNECEDNIIKPQMLPSEIMSNSITITQPDTSLDMISMPLREAREMFERQYLTAQMSRFNNNISKTSSFIGMERSALHRKLKLLKIHSSSRSRLDDDEMEDETMGELV